MDPRFLLNLFVGALALLGWAVLIIFLIEFRAEVTTHPIYRMPEGPANLPGTTGNGESNNLTDCKATRRS
jgi:hypothetical protein